MTVADSLNSEPKIVTTRDGSHTVYSNRFDQHYHNPNGAVAESRYVFFEQTGLPEGLKNREQGNILEVGFGTGLNLLLLLDYYLENNSRAKITYHSIEGYPLNSQIAGSFNYKEHIANPELASEVTPIFDSLDEGMNEIDIIPNISVKLFNGLFDDYPSGDIAANYIFHDAFSPNANPELWTGEVFQKLKKCSSPDVILSTYCAASAARGAMAWAGWKIARARGALGKREMTLAALDENLLKNLDRVNEERLAKRYETGDF